MKVVIAGGHGKVALKLAGMLAQRGDEAVGIIRNPGHAHDVRAVGATPVLLDLEAASTQQVADTLHSADAVVFAAGSGPGSSSSRKGAVDRDAAVLVADAAQAAAVRRMVVLSSMGADVQATWPDDEQFALYLRAKGAADAAIRERTPSLDWTILRPGYYTDEPGTGHVLLATATRAASIPRQDVAAVLLALLDEPGTAGMTLELIAGDTPIHDAVTRAAGR